MKAKEAPEKIYRTTTYLDNNRGKTVWKVAPVKGAENIEYIRKDALLEWAKIKQTQCLENSTAHAYFQMFIDKINCM